jgi:hypothetical protein
MSLAETLLGKEKAEQRRDVLSQLEADVERTGSPRAKSLLRRFLEFEAKIGQTVLEKGGELARQEVQRIREEKARERASQTGRSEQYPVGSIFAPLLQEERPTPRRRAKKLTRARIDNLIRELEELRAVV